MDWAAMAQSLLAREIRPVLLISASGGVVLEANPAMRQLLGATFPRPVESVMDEVSVVALREAMESLPRGGRTRVALRLGGCFTFFEPTFELEQLGAGQPLLAMVVAVEGGMFNAPVRPALGRHYEVRVDAEGRPTRARAVLTESGCRVADPGLPCYRELEGRDSPCPSCPVLKAGKGDFAVTTRLGPPGEDFLAFVGVARRVGANAFAVSQVPLAQESYSQLLAARVEHLATRAGLTEREQNVLHLVLLNRSIEEIATHGGVSDRATKYHLQAILKKLGAESRLDLFRLLL